MTKARAKTNAIRNAGQKTPGDVATRIQRPPTTEPHQKNLCRNTKPSAGSPVRETAEGLDYRFLRSQPRVIGPGSLRKARPRRSEYNLNTHPHDLNIEPSFNNRIRALQSHTEAR